MKYISRKEKNSYPNMAFVDNQRAPQASDNVSMGRVEIDNDKCNGCKLCVAACPGNSLEMAGKKEVRMPGVGANCIGCGDCVPICHPGAIRVTRYLEYKGLYKTLGRSKASGPRKF